MKYASTSKSLRPYQQELLRDVQAALQCTDEPVMMQLPTGGGKTIIAAALLSQYLTGRRKAVWLTHRKELASQTENMLRKEGVKAKLVDRKKWKTGTKAPTIANGVVILMVQTVAHRVRTPSVWDGYGDEDLMIVDEAHHSTADSWERAIRTWPGKVLGMTATPWRLSRAKGFDHLFHELILGPQIGELKAQGYLCQAQVLWPDEGDRIRGGKVGSQGDYTPEGIKEANAKNIEVMTSRALKFWQKYADDRQTIIYAVSVGHARKLMAIYKREGIAAETILGETDEAMRADAIRDFTEGYLKVLINVDVATEGFDLPDVSCIVITRPTKSLSLYLQMVGRGLRRKENGGDCLILDLANNRLEHGLPEDYREWSLAAWGGTEGETSPMVLCEKCQTTSPAASHSCKSCGSPFVKRCPICARPRAFRTAWLLEDLCGSTHEPVCDRCHIDVHVQYNNLPFVFPFQQESQEDLYFMANLVYENPRIVAKALLAALIEMDGSVKAKYVHPKIKGALYEIQCSRIGLDCSKEDLEKAHSAISLKDLPNLPEPEQLRQIYMFTYTGCIVDKSTENVYDRLEKSGFCVRKQQGKRWCLSKKFLKLVQDIPLQSPNGDE